MSTRDLFHLPPRPPAPPRPPLRQVLRRSLPFLLSWTAITTLSFHLLITRKEKAALRSRAQSQISLLEEMVGRYRRGERVPEEEVERGLRLVGLRGVEGEGTGRGVRGEKIGWGEVLFGQERPEGERERVREEVRRTEREWERVLQELDSGSSAEGEAPSKEEEKVDAHPPPTVPPQAREPPPPEQQIVRRAGQTAKGFL